MLKCFIFALFIFSCMIAEPCRGQSGIVIYTKTAVAFELQGYAGLETISIYRGTLTDGESRRVETSYKGLAMLIFSGGQKYPVIVGRNSSEVIITSPDKAPSFEGGDENYHFYTLLSGAEAADKGNSFARLMIQGKELLDSSSSIKTVAELQAQKIKFQEFVQRNYLEVSQSDLLGRFISQYFMMHEYVHYHREGIPGEDIRSRYQQEVLAGVRSLLALLQEKIPENKLLNYIVGLYYNRGMVTLASFIADNFREVAYCSGEVPELDDFPQDLKLIGSDGSATRTLGTLKGSKLVSFVSSDCPVSMVATVIKAREAADEKGHAGNRFIIVAPLEKLSAKHRAMSRNVSGDTMLFVDDAGWQKKYQSKDIRLPFFVNIATPKI